LLTSFAALDPETWRPHQLSLSHAEHSQPTTSHRQTSLSTMLIEWRSHRIEINPWNPVYALAPFVLLSVSIPLTIFAVVTTSIAISLLACRAFVVYVQLLVAIVGAWINPEPPIKTSTPRQCPSTLSPEASSPNRQRQLHSSSTVSLDTIIPSARASWPNSGGFFLPIPPANEIPRDYEGVGGWRTPGNDDEEALWMGMNSRLRLQGDTPIRRHQRSNTGGSSPDAIRMSPIQSRVRTPVRFAVDEEEDYFSPHGMTSVRRTSNASDSSRNHKRRKSGSSSSSSGLMMASREPGE
jgi:hypothetical protein